MSNPFDVPAKFIMAEHERAKLDKLNLTVYIVDVGRWVKFTAQVPSAQTFHNSEYYLHECNETGQTFLVELGIDHNIAIVHNPTGFLKAVNADYSWPKSLRDLFGKIYEGTPSESVDDCIRLHLMQADQFPMIEIHSRRDEHGNAIDGDEVLAAIAKRIADQWNANKL